MAKFVKECEGKIVNPFVTKSHGNGRILSAPESVTINWRYVQAFLGKSLRSRIEVVAKVFA